MERDMTVGTPWKIILNFTIPIVIGNIFQQFYSMVDTVIVGKFVGTKALAQTRPSFASPAYLRHRIADWSAP